MAIQKFDPDELTVVGEMPGFFGAPPTPVYNFPITPKEAFIALYKREPAWQITGVEQVLFCPKVNPDNVARAFVFDGSGMLPSSGGGKDMFGIEWEYIAQVGGSMVRPGKPFLASAGEWREKLVWPDIESWDWEGAAKVNKEYLGTSKYNCCWLMNGWYERLISFMDFEGAVVAMIDDEQTDAVKALFDRLSDLYIKIIDKYLIYFPQIDGFCIHDDWGSQKDTFFSPATVKEMIVPYMRRVNDYLHSRGKFSDLHSCGQLYKQVPNIIDAGWDSWGGQLMNDTHKIYEEYGDKIIIAVTPDAFDPATTTEEDQRAAAREYAAKFCNSSKPSMFNIYGSLSLTRAFREELYIQSRKNYGRQAAL